MTELVRMHRFTLEGTYLKPECVYSVDIDWTEQVIEMNCLEIIEEDDIPIHTWCDSLTSGKLKDEQLTLTTYTPSGKIIYEFEMYGLKIVNRRNHFNHSDFDASTHRVTLTYDYAKRINFKQTSIQLQHI